ncbi:element excision factor XisI family protein [Aetokthonos hydrillicola]|uniref:element excision factor XisI family protein n=1 Tax=Aetokthonos hydrillicola TaxID=1550245 RepID=UPI0036F3BBE9
MIGWNCTFRLNRLLWQRNHYQIVHLGWQHKRWVHDCVIHLDIRIACNTIASNMLICHPNY